MFNLGIVYLQIYQPLVMLLVSRGTTPLKQVQLSFLSQTLSKQDRAPSLKLGRGRQSVCNSTSSASGGAVQLDFYIHKKRDIF